MKPAPFMAALAALLDGEGKELTGAAEGNLVIRDSWPGQMRTVYGDHKRFVETYFSTFDNCYTTGDGARRDEDGYYWITGRVDDVINVSGHRMGTAEVESALVAHAKVAEAAVVGYPHEIKGQGIYVYVTLMEGIAPSDELKAELRIPETQAKDVQLDQAVEVDTRNGVIPGRVIRIDPRVAMCSYSTGTSGAGKDVDKVREALEILKRDLNSLSAGGGFDGKEEEGKEIII